MVYNVQGTLYVFKYPLWMVLSYSMSNLVPSHDCPIMVQVTPVSKLSSHDCLCMYHCLILHAYNLSSIFPILDILTAHQKFYKTICLVETAKFKQNHPLN